MTAAAAVLVWDQTDDLPSDPGKVLCWRSYAAGENMASVPGYLEAHAERIRGKYLAFIHELGETLIGGRRIVDHLDAGEGLSFWWMTTLAEKSPLKSPRIYDCLRLFALEEMLTEFGAFTLTLVTADEALAGAIQAMCRNLNAHFRWRRARRANRNWSLRRFYEGLPFPLKGLLSLRHLVMRWPLRKLRSPAWFTGGNAVFICSYFIHLDPSLCARGQFHSGQWEGLPNLLRQSDRPINWLQLFLFSAAVPRVETAISWTRLFNADARNEGCHSFLDSYLTAPLVWKAVRTWLWLCAVSMRLRDIGPAFRPCGSALWLWPMLRDDWRVSLSGQIGMGNCLALAQFDAALADLPRQPTGFYLCENQAWEKSLLWCWRKHGHGRIIGVQHATAPFWHLYYSDDPRSLNSQRSCPLPLPDLLAVNGTAVFKAFVATGYPEGRLVQVEALRYLNLAQIAVKRQNNVRSQERATQSGVERSRVKVIVLGDLIPESMRHLFSLIEGALAELGRAYELTLKPHPGYSPDVAEHPGLNMAVVREPLGQIIANYEVAIAANSTSAAVDAFVAGLPVIVALDGDALNLSPLRGQPGVHFVTSREDLANALRIAERAEGLDSAVKTCDSNAFFFLDPQMPRWQRLMRTTWPTTP